MTVAHFSTLSLSDQIEYLYCEGVYLTKRKHAGEWVILYQLNQLYVEIFYRRYRGVVRYLRCSTHIGTLDPYLENVSISGILPDQV